ncbi:hypothetical protein AB0301_08755 [Microbacterium profundi]|uniref:Uncharacterized protein n=1 Tax=Microbacterium profundi TaxID=450380 RepID=A0ABV3LGW8_9MICO|nr:hypothetical protein [Microbacterium profundi]MCE7483085.1 hypothetical protein [Microbacterium profundi]
MTRELARYFVTYYANGEYLDQDEYSDIPPAIGHGVETNGNFYRITDVWHVRHKHAPVTHGIAVFLEEVPIPQVFKEVDASYYT